MKLLLMILLSVFAIGCEEEAETTQAPAVIAPVVDETEEIEELDQTPTEEGETTEPIYSQELTDMQNAILQAKEDGSLTYGASCIVGGNCEVTINETTRTITSSELEQMTVWLKESFPDLQITSSDTAPEDAVDPFDDTEGVPSTIIETLRNMIANGISQIPFASVCDDSEQEDPMCNISFGEDRNFEVTPIVKGLIDVLLDRLASNATNAPAEDDSTDLGEEEIVDEESTEEETAEEDNAEEPETTDTQDQE